VTGIALHRLYPLLGDSIAFGFVDHEWTFTHLIENARHKTRPMTRVLHQSVLGYATDQEVRLLEGDGWSLEPDGVVVAFCLNDFEDYSGELPLFDPSTHLAEGGFHRLAPRRLGGAELPEPLPLLDRSLFFRKLSEHFERATAAGFKVVDLLEAFSAESLAALRLQPNDVLHLIKRGHMVTARVLAPCLTDPALRCPKQGDHSPLDSSP
jgi:hypothetical protein